MKTWNIVDDVTLVSFARGLISGRNFYNLFKNYKSKLTFLLKNLVKVSNSSKFETYFFHLNLNGNSLPFACKARKAQSKEQENKKFENTYKKLQNKDIFLNQSFSFCECF